MQSREGAGRGWILMSCASSSYRATRPAKHQVSAGRHQDWNSPMSEKQGSPMQTCEVRSDLNVQSFTPGRTAKNPWSAECASLRPETQEILGCQCYRTLVGTNYVD
eukprot:687344-Prorocentrum_minimum.AAC.1